MRTDGVSLLGRRQVQDQRFVHSRGDRDRALDQVAGVATILLGLLRRSFRWPALWNPIEERRIRSGIMRGLLRQSPCSSWTMAVIEGSLLPRNRETVLLGMLMSLKEDDDTPHDPPRFASLSELIRGLGRAKRVLETYQISVQNHEPRQMVPISLTQISESQWSAEEDASED